MRYRDGRAFRRALEDRLKAKAGADRGRLVRDRRRVVFDRLLARLAATNPDRWVLKGGYGLELRLAERARATKDLDLDWHGRTEEVLDALLDAAAHDAGDFFVFMITRAGPSNDRPNGPFRFRADAFLADKPFHTIFFDIGVWHGATIEVQHVATPGLLTFADVPPVEIAALPLEFQVAEKVHAYTRPEPRWRLLGVTELLDLQLIAESGPLDRTQLLAAMETTFAHWDTHPIPGRLPAPPEERRAAFRRLAEAVGVRHEMFESHAVVAELLDPVLEAASEHQVDPIRELREISPETITVREDDVTVPDRLKRIRAVLGRLGKALPELDGETIRNRSDAELREIVDRHKEAIGRFPTQEAGKLRRLEKGSQRLVDEQARTQGEVDDLHASRAEVAWWRWGERRRLREQISGRQRKLEHLRHAVEAAERRAQRIEGSERGPSRWVERDGRGAVEWAEARAELDRRDARGAGSESTEAGTAIEATAGVEPQIPAPDIGLGF